MLDEIEELQLVLQHYAITWGIKLPPHPNNVKEPWASWALRRVEQGDRDGGDEHE